MSTGITQHGNLIRHNLISPVGGDVLEPLEYDEECRLCVLHGVDGDVH